MPILNPEQKAEMMKSLEAEGQAEAPGGVGDQTSTSPERYEEAPPEAPPPLPELPASLRVKIHGKEEDVPIFKDGAPNPLLIERFQMGEDYYRKTQSLAEKERAWEAERQGYMTAQAEKDRLASEVERLNKLVEQSQGFDISGDDDYARAIRYLNDQVKKVQQMVPDMQHSVSEVVRQIRDQEGQRVVALETSRLQQQHGLSEQDTRRVLSDWKERVLSGQEVTTDQVAQEHASYLKTLKEQAIAEWKEKHRVKTETVAKETAAGAVGASGDKTSIRDRSFRDRVMAHVMAQET